MWPALLLLLCLQACKGSEAEPTEPPPPAPKLAESGSAKAEAKAGERQGAEVLPPVRPGFSLQMRYEGLSPLYRNFFSDDAARTALAAAVSRHLTEDAATVVVAWDENRVRGVIRLLTTTREPLVAGVGERLRRDGVFDPAPIAPLLAAVGDYRATMGANYDLRLLSFHIEVAVQDKDSARYCWIRGLLNDPQGHKIDACVLCSVLDRKQPIALCADKLPAKLEGEAEGLAALQRCFAAR